MSELLFDSLHAVKTTSGKTVVKERRTPSANQAAILAFRSNPANMHLMIRATAGSGKTTVLEMIGETIISSGDLQKGEKAVFLAYNVEATKKLKDELPAELDVRTLNSIGNQIIKENLVGAQFSTKKYADLIANALSRRDYRKRELKVIRESLEQSVQISMGHALHIGCPKEEWLDAMNEFGVSVTNMEDDLYGLTMEVMRAGMDQMDEEGLYSFPDQVYAPFHKQWRLNEPYKHVLVDEAQDMTRGQMALVLLSITHEDSRITCVGDPSQGIYGFSGASQSSMDDMRVMLDAQELPLSVTYRCPVSHTNLARPYTDMIESAPGAKEGVLDYVSDDQFVELVGPDDLVMCRTNAPLVAYAYKLARYGKKYYVLGREIAGGLVSFAREASVWDGQAVNRKQLDETATLNGDEYRRRLQSYYHHRAKKLKEALEASSDRAGAEQEVALTDRLDIIQMILAEQSPPTLGDLITAIRDLFHKGSDAVKLSSIHKAKGQEARRVFILDSHLLPHPAAKRPEDLKVEQAVMFVAFTRSKDTLLFVVSEDSADAPFVIPPELRRPAGSASSA